MKLKFVGRKVWINPDYEVYIDMITNPKAPTRGCVLLKFEILELNVNETGNIIMDSLARKKKVMIDWERFGYMEDVS